MKFYEAIAQFYDEIFPLKGPQLAAMTRTAGAPPARILDLACGTGSYSIALAEKGYDVTAADLDDVMVSSVKKKAKGKQLPLEVKQFNMLEVENAVNGKYDTVVCIGNSLVHLNSIHDVRVCLTGIKRILNPGGKLLIQIVNYDRVIYHLVTKLPTIKNESVDLTFERYYDFDEGEHRINFKGILRVGDYQSSEVVTLLPLKSENIVDLLRLSGFRKIALYGGFDCSPFQALDSMALVVVAE